MLNKFILCAFTLLWATAVASEPIQIKNIPHIYQKEDFCGEACVAMAMQAQEIQITQDEVFNYSGLNPKQARGCYTRELNNSLKNLGLKPGPTWHTYPVKEAEIKMKGLFQEILLNLKRNIPTVVCMRYDSQENTTEHFRLITGYDPKKEEVVYHEPAEKNGAYKRMALKQFYELWPLKYQENWWTIIQMPIRVDENLKYIRTRFPKGYSPADYAQHIIKLKPKLPKGFVFKIQHPFVLITDATKTHLNHWGKGTVAWAVKKLKEKYFKKEPLKILDVWLFKGAKSYRKYTKEIFNHDPDTPYGYYSYDDGALIMNIATGGGTLIHEIVHPYMESNFPACPAWFNEGLGSLYEQAAESKNEIVGLPNWRLEGLQKAIRNNSLPSFKTLCSPGSFNFRVKDPGTNYAQARYLCYYLQENKLLKNYYNLFVQNHLNDASGYESLKEILGKPDMNAFQKKWEKWIMTLKFE